MARGDATIDELAKQIDAIRSDVAELNAILSKIASEEIDAARSRIREAAASVSGKGERLAGVVRECASASADDVEAAIRRNPFSAVLVAVGLGFLFGLFTRR